MKIRNITTTATIAITTAVGIAALTSAAPPPPAQATVQHLPPGMHWRYIYPPVRDCGNMHGKPGIVVWRGNGDMQSALFCPNGAIQLS